MFSFELGRRLSVDLGWKNHVFVRTGVGGGRFRFVSFRFASFRFVSFRFVLFCFVSFRFVSFRFILFRFVSFRFVSYLGLGKCNENALSSLDNTGGGRDGR